MADGARRERSLAFYLIPAMIVAVGVIAWFTFRTSFQLEKLREQSVVEATLSLANEKADRLDKMIIEQDDAVASEIDVSDYRASVERWLRVAGRQTPTVRGVLVVNVTDGANEVVAFGSRVPGPEDERFRRLLVYDMLPTMELEAYPRAQLRHLHGSYEGQNFLLSYWQRDHNNNQFLVVAWQDVSRIVHSLMPKLYGEREDQSRVNVVDEDGLIVFGPPLSAGEFTIGRPFQTTLYKWRLNVTLSSAQELAENVERRRALEIALVGLSMLVIVAGILVILVAAGRERKLANLKSEFVANVSHELKTPLSLVRMFGELLQSGRVESDAKRRQYIQIIVNESERLGALIENVLDFARLEKGKTAYEFAEGDVGDVVARAVDVCRERADRGSLSIQLDIASHLPPTWIDERAIEIAVINLVDNAIKYASMGGQVWVAVAATDRRVEIRVTDHGPGIPPDERKRIFDRFVRGGEAKQQRVRGSGIGLAMVKNIAEAHGGAVWVESAEPQGSVFVFTVRSKAVRQPDPSVSQSESEAVA